MSRVNVPGCNMTRKNNGIVPGNNLPRPKPGTYLISSVTALLQEKDKKENKILDIRSNIIYIVFNVNQNRFYQNKKSKEVL